MYCTCRYNVHLRQSALQCTVHNRVHSIMYTRSSAPHRHSVLTMYNVLSMCTYTQHDANISLWTTVLVKLVPVPIQMGLQKSRHHSKQISLMVVVVVVEVIVHILSTNHLVAMESTHNQLESSHRAVENTYHTTVENAHNPVKNTQNQVKNTHH